MLAYLTAPEVTTDLKQQRHDLPMTNTPPALPDSEHIR